MRAPRVCSWRGDGKPLFYMTLIGQHADALAQAISHAHIELLPCPCEVEGLVLNGKQDIMTHDRPLG